MNKDFCKKILYVGELNYGGTCLQRLGALLRYGHKVTTIDISQPFIKNFSQNIILKIINKIYFIINIINVNNRINKIIDSNLFDILWIDKGLTIKPSLLKKFKKFNLVSLIIGYSGDDMFQKHNQSKWWIKGLCFYDFYITTKSYNVYELLSAGIKCVKFVNNCYDIETHKPIKINKKKKSFLGGAVGFIGAWENERLQSILFIANSGIPVRWWGGGWSGKRDYKHNCPNLIYENVPLWGLDYCKAINSFDINLCFLRKINRDLQTSRSVEIPACGGFMLAERTAEHQNMFIEGKEAEFFSSNEELLSKVKFYLKNPNIRKRIAKAGRERCMQSRYSYDFMISKIFKKIQYC